MGAWVVGSGAFMLRGVGCFAVCLRLLFVCLPAGFCVFRVEVVSKQARCSPRRPSMLYHQN